MAGRKRGHILQERELLRDEAVRALIELRGCLCLNVMHGGGRVDISRHGKRLEDVEEALRKLEKGELPESVSLPVSHPIATGRILSLKIADLLSRIAGLPNAK
jgi:hypothetical protein